MSLSRLELDGLGSPVDIAARIHELQPDLPLDFPIEQICSALDIIAIDEVTTNGFEAALIMDPNKAMGSILLAAERRPERQRFSIGHKLGHFLIPTHLPRPGEPFECSLADIQQVDTRELNRRKRVEAEANKFAAQLLMSPKRVRAGMLSRQPDLRDIIRLAGDFAMSKEAMARAYVDAQRATVAVLILKDGLLHRAYRGADFPWIETVLGQPVPQDSIAHGHRLIPGEFSESEECDPEVWFEVFNAARVEVITEQLYGQSFGFAMLLLHVELADD